MRSRWTSGCSGEVDTGLPTRTCANQNASETPPWPGHALVAARLRLDTLIDELLDALTLVGLGRVEVALRVGRDRVHAVELAGLASAVAERGDLLERVAQDHAHALVLPVGQEHELLVGVARERDVPHR